MGRRVLCPYISALDGRPLSKRAEATPPVVARAGETGGRDAGSPVLRGYGTNFPSATSK